MKHRIIYYIALLAPAAALAYFRESIPATLDLALLGIYVFVYRTILDGMRLAQKGLILKKDVWKMILPGMRGKYFKELYL